MIAASQVDRIIPLDELFPSTLARETDPRRHDTSLHWLVSFDADNLRSADHRYWPAHHDGMAGLSAIGTDRWIPDCSTGRAASLYDRRSLSLTLANALANMIDEVLCTVRKTEGRSLCIQPINFAGRLWEGLVVCSDRTGQDGDNLGFAIFLYVVGDTFVVVV